MPGENASHYHETRQNFVNSAQLPTPLAECRLASSHGVVLRSLEWLEIAGVRLVMAGNDHDSVLVGERDRGLRIHDERLACLYA